ncbi:PREDICTED: uncharacterized protein LOC108977696 [Bactrocera latifrons]|uniref:Uncharacterized protein n=1 Tax=Bactrocera latifrons TaxID=174628 RepID=A0A0K8U563_BACLA|nr:PREDICTED: uncharacterized protein LOC108977696 [Bactrocera latifrons]
MTDGDNSNALYDIIRKELNLIINENSPPQPDDSKKAMKLNEGTHSQLQKTSEAVYDGDIITKTPTPAEHLSTMLSSNILHLPTNESQSAIIDTDLQKMRYDLQQSYELFQTMGERFQSINFSSLKNRIKDMNLSKQDRTAKLNEEMKDVLEKHYNNNTLNSLTAEMGEKFQNHPGEFGNIPELSEFFQTCSQLQHGLEQLKRQRNSVSEMTKRLSNATEASFTRIDHIYNIMNSTHSGQIQNLQEYQQNS